MNRCLIRWFVVSCQEMCKVHCIQSRGRDSPWVVGFSNCSVCILCVNVLLIKLYYNIVWFILTYSNRSTSPTKVLYHSVVIQQCQRSYYNSAQAYETFTLVYKSTLSELMAIKDELDQSYFRQVGNTSTHTVRVLLFVNMRI